jgi:hypothetical protein
MLVAAPRIRRAAALTRSEAAVEHEHDPPGRRAYVDSVTEEAAYLETDDDEKPEVDPGPKPDPAWFKCWFSRKSTPEVRKLYGAEYPVRNPETLATITLIFSCNECVAKFATW